MFGFKINREDGLLPLYRDGMQFVQLTEEGFTENLVINPNSSFGIDLHMQRKLGVEYDNMGNAFKMVQHIDKITINDIYLVNLTPVGAAVSSYRTSWNEWGVTDASRDVTLINTRNSVTTTFQMEYRSLKLFESTVKSSAEYGLRVYDTDTNRILYDSGNERILLDSSYNMLKYNDEIVIPYDSFVCIRRYKSHNHVFSTGAKGVYMVNHPSLVRIGTTNRFKVEIMRSRKTGYGQVWAYYNGDWTTWAANMRYDPLTGLGINGNSSNAFVPIGANNPIIEVLIIKP